MKATIDASGRVLIPQHLQDALGLKPGTEVSITTSGSVLEVIPEEKTARVERRDGRLVIVGEGEFTDDMLYRLIDESRQWPRIY